MLAVLTVVYALNIADRFSISTLIEPIREELQLSDSGIAFLTGVALAVFYVTVGIPIAELATIPSIALYWPGTCGRAAPRSGRTKRARVDERRKTQPPLFEQSALGQLRPPRGWLRRSLDRCAFWSNHRSWFSVKHTVLEISDPVWVCVRQ